AIVTTGDFPGSISIPGTGTSIRISGFVQINTIYDFDNLGAEELLRNRMIPLDGSEEDGEEQLRFHARNTRLNVDVRRDTRLGPFRAFVEADFFGGGEELVSNYELRLRHGIARLGDFYLGQWWSNFIDIPSRPELNDDGGPLGSPGIRQPGIRWQRDLEHGWRIGLSLENPGGDLSGDESELASDSFPDIIGAAQLTRPWGRLRIAGLLRRLESKNDDVYVGAVNFTGRIPLRFLGDRDNLSFAVQAGRGFTRYYGTFTTAGLDGFINNEGNIDPVGGFGGYVAYQHWWSDRLQSNFTFSFLDLDLPDSAPSDSFDNGIFAEANLFWTPVDDVTMGAGIVYGDREDFNGAEGSGVRFHGSIRYDF
ncbi:MAG: DcaP family trimeric outer membrane transporter, partial [Cyanobacteria bacterium P01_F01_bin.153]